MKTTRSSPRQSIGVLSQMSLGVKLVFACGLGLTISCTQEAPVVLSPVLDTNAVASVQGNVIPEEAYRRKLGGRIGRAGLEPSAADKEAVLEEMVRQESVYAQAKAAKFDQRPEIAALIKSLVI